MRKRLVYGSGIGALAVLVTLVVWQGSFSFGDYGPENPAQTFLFWAVSTLVFILTLTLGFMLFRTGVKLYIERRSNKEGSRIRTKLVVGVLALSFLPVFFLVLWSVSVLNRNLDKWFSRPPEAIRASLVEASQALEREGPKEEQSQALAAARSEIDRYAAQYDQLILNRRSVRSFYLLLLSLLTLFILFIATWMALFMARQISVPISALLNAAGEVRKGNLGYRVQVPAIDELATLVRSFNQMTEALENNRRELDSRRRFTEAILESIPTGVISLAADGRILRVNNALGNILPGENVARAERLEDLFGREDAAEIKYLMKRARRTGLAASQLELKTERRTLHLAITVSALETKLTSGFVVVLEDTSELLRAQRTAAWHEVARRIAHEIKNPLTPIALSAERILRQLDRAGLTAETGPHSPRMRLQHRHRSRVSEGARGRVLAVRAVSRGAAVPLRSQRGRRQRARSLLRPSGRHRSGQGSGAGSSAGQYRPRAVQARGGEPGGQCGRGHAGFAGQAAPRLHPRRGGCGRAGRGRQRLWSVRRGKGETVSALFLDQGARHGAGAGDRQSHSDRAQRPDSRRG